MAQDERRRRSRRGRPAVGRAAGTSRRRQREGSESRFYEDPWFQGTAAVVGLLGAVWAFVGAPKPWGIIDDLFSSELPGSNTEIVLDASAAMKEPFGGSGTKLDAAAATAGNYAEKRRHEGFALRRFGGECDETGDLLVDFGADHGDDVRDSAAEQEPGGRSNLADAVIGAVDDFNDSDRWPDRDSPKRIVVFTGTVDNCAGESAGDEIRREVDRTNIDVEFQLVGVKVSRQERERLRAITNDLGKHAEVVFANTEEELDTAVQYLDASAVITDADAVLSSWDGIIDRINDFVSALNAGELESAEHSLEAAREAFERAPTRADVLADLQDRPEFSHLAALVANSPLLNEEDWLSTAESLLEFRRALREDGDERAYENAQAEWEGIVRQQDEVVSGVERALDDLIETLPAVEREGGGPCSSDPVCIRGTAGEPSTTADCDDGLDNDGDMLVDAEDPDCAQGETEEPGGGNEEPGEQPTPTQTVPTISTTTTTP